MFLSGSPKVFIHNSPRASCIKRSKDNKKKKARKSTRSTRFILHFSHMKKKWEKLAILRNTYCQFSVNAFWSHLTIQPPHFLLFLPLLGFPGSNAASYREHSLITLLEWFTCSLCSHNTWISIKHKWHSLSHNFSLRGRQLIFMCSVIHKSFLPSITQPHSVYYCLYFIVKKSTTRSGSPSPIDPNSLTSVKMSLQLSKCRNARTSREWPEGGRGEGWLQKQGDQSFFGGRSVTR